MTCSCAARFHEHCSSHHSNTTTNQQTTTSDDIPLLSSCAVNASQLDKRCDLWNDPVMTHTHTSRLRTAATGVANLLDHMLTSDDWAAWFLSMTLFAGLLLIIAAFAVTA